MDDIDKIMNQEVKESRLIVELRESENLTSEKKSEYIGLAHIFLQDFKANLNRTSMELDEKTPIGIDTWREWLNFPVVKKYLKQFRYESMENIVDKGLMAGDKSVVNIKKALDGDGLVTNNSNILLVRVPEKRDFVNEIKMVELDESERT